MRSLPHDGGAEWAPYGWHENRFERLNRAWLYTSLLHDCAYSVELARDAQMHELRVRAMFGRVYQPGAHGRVDIDRARQAGEPLWSRRSRIIGRPVTRGVRRTLDEIERRPDHAFVTAQALMAEAEHQSAPLSDILEIAAASLACHNFRWKVDPKARPEADVVDWFGLDFWQEPLAGLITVADEIQEWGRERVDLALHYEQGRKTDFVSESAILTHLSVDDAAGLTIDANLHFRLFPEDRANREQRATQREMANSETNRTYRNGFRPRDRDHRMFDLHLRISETVEDVPCRVARRFGWPVEGGGSLLHRSEQALKRPWKSPGQRFEEVEVVLPTDGADVIVRLAADGTATTHGHRDAGTPLRALVVAPGGAGKSTLLRALADTGRLGRRTVSVVYVEELGDDVSGLVDECEGARADGNDVLLLVDHLDRLVGTPKEAYWLDQLDSLPSESWLHVVGACRPEEFESVIGFTLEKGFSRADMSARVGPLMETTDGDGRATARGIERYLRGHPDSIERLGVLALAMKKRRFLDRPAEGLDESVTFAEAPVLSRSSGSVRFIHDAVQDYFSARALGHELERPTGSATAWPLRSLLQLPADVFRLLLDLLVTSRQVTRTRRVQMAQGLARALRSDATFRHWAFDLGRLVRAREAIEAFHDAFARDEEIAPIALMLRGLVMYNAGRSWDLRDRGRRNEQRDHSRQNVEVLALTVRALAPWWTACNRTDAEVLTVYVADHLVTLLSRAAVSDGDRAFAQELRATALRAMGDVEVCEGLSPSWVRSHVDRFNPHSSCASTLIAMDDDIGKKQREPFLMRRFQLAGHIAGTFLLVPKLGDLEQFARALHWTDRAIARADRVLRHMEAAPGNGECFGSLAHGRGDAARHYSMRISFWAGALHEGIVERGDGVYRLLEATEAYNAAHRLARRVLRPGERLPAAWWNSIVEEAFGRTLLKAHSTGGHDAEAARGELRKQLDAVNSDYRRWGEKHPNFREGADYEFLEARVGEVGEFVSILTTRIL